jgi:flagellar hook-basal body complex protein FliE
VFYALEQSSMSLQMMMAVRNRLVEGFQEIMRMQL